MMTLIDLIGGMLVVYKRLGTTREPVGVGRSEHAENIKAAERRQICSPRREPWVSVSLRAVSRRAAKQ
jgi:hypothetical protein